MAKPGAVPFGLNSTKASSGTMAWTRVRSGMRRLRTSKNCEICASTRGVLVKLLAQQPGNQLAGDVSPRSAPGRRS
jgi:hypothetical protein